MRLSHLTLTGADDAVDPAALARLSDEAPLLEWGVLFSAEHEGQPRFPSQAWRQAFHRDAPRARRAAHLCGRATLDAAVEAGQPLGWELRGDDLPAGADRGPYQRIQLNFDVRDLPAASVAAWSDAWLAGGWHDCGGGPMGLITQHNDANARVHERFRQRTPGAVAGGRHAVLFDASGGTGTAPRAWAPPLPGLDCGYAGGLGPENLAAQLAAIAAVAGPHASVWIDMEARLRGPDDRFDLQRVRAVIEIVRGLAAGAPLQPGVQVCAAAR